MIWLLFFHGACYPDKYFINRRIINRMLTLRVFIVLYKTTCRYQCYSTNCGNKKDDSNNGLIPGSFQNMLYQNQISSLSLPQSDKGQR